MSAATTMTSQRHTKLTSSEAAMLAGELTKPSWQSKNEGIHERVSFEDSIWGFDLAGGSFYKTPLRVTAVKKDSRADKAGILPGDQLLRINDIDTSTLTIQEAHAIIIESGVHIRLAVSAPDDTEDSYSCWQDQIEDPYDSEEERRKEIEKAKKRIIHCRTNANWSLQWPWVSKRRIIYKESNCFMVPSKYETKHIDKFPNQLPGLQAPSDIVLHSKTSNTPTTEGPKQLIFPETNNGLTEKVNNKLNSNGTSDSILQESSKGIDINGNSEENEIVETQINKQNENAITDKIPETKEFEKENSNDTESTMTEGDVEGLMDIYNKDVALNGNSDENENNASQVNTHTDKVLEATEFIDGIKNHVLENWTPNNTDSAMEEDNAEELLEDMLNEPVEIKEDEQDKLLDEVLNGHDDLQIDLGNNSDEG